MTDFPPSEPSVPSSPRFAPPAAVPPAAPPPGGFALAQEPPPAEPLPPSQPSVRPEGRVAITAADLRAPSVDARIEQLQTSRTPLTRVVGDASNAASSRFGRTTLVFGLLGVAGGAVGWALAEIVTGGDDSRWTNATFTTAMFIGCLATGLGAVLLSWQGINARSPERVGRDLRFGLPIVVVGGLIGGVIAQQIYYPMVRGALERAFREANSYEEFRRMMSGALHFPRGIAFMLAGVAIGAGLGLAARSMRRAQNAVIGGVVGGFIGGFMFDYVGDWIEASSGAVPRLVALCITGGLIGLAIGLVDELRRDLWLEIVSGGMAGKQFIVWEQRCSIGSDASCDITLIKDPQILPRHAMLVRVGDTVSIATVDGAPEVRVDGRSTNRAPITEGSMIEIGQTVLRVGQRQAKMPTMAGQ